MRRQKSRQLALWLWQLLVVLLVNLMVLLMVTQAGQG